MQYLPPLAGEEHVGGARRIERACQVISQIHDLLDASAIDILQGRFQGQTIPMDIGNDRQRSLKGLRLAQGFLFSHSRVYIREFIPSRWAKELQKLIKDDSCLKRSCSTLGIGGNDANFYVA